MASRQHGLTTMNATRPKKKPSLKRNKLLAKQRKKPLLKALNDAILAGRSAKAKKPATPAKQKKTVEEPKEKAEI